MVLGTQKYKIKKSGVRHSLGRNKEKFSSSLLYKEGRVMVNARSQIVSLQLKKVLKFLKL